MLVCLRNILYKLRSLSSCDAIFESLKSFLSLTLLLGSKTNDEASCRVHDMRRQQGVGQLHLQRER